ncbi:hypothetical protein Ddc_23067 [Ditylenchus destructor]|nr:hypothetical protein Ddc_23067 [Ditylenchus destructor]
MTSNNFHCHICHVDLADNESTFTKHISSFHLNYRPYNCRTCYGEGNIFKAATVEDMDAHIAILHGATNYGYHAIKDQTKEIELKTAVEEYRRVSTLQHSSAGTRINWHQNTAFYRPADIHENVQEVGGTSTDTESILTEVKQENPESEIEIIEMDNDDEQREAKQEREQVLIR